jgi:hypothetical protein
MLHTVEIGSFCGDVVAAVGNMMTWLNSRGSQPVNLATSRREWDRIPPAVQQRRRGTGLCLCVRRPVGPLRPESSNTLFTPHAVLPGRQRCRETPLRNRLRHPQ